MLNEVAGDELFFQVITRTGKTVDSGVIARQPKPRLDTVTTRPPRRTSQADERSDEPVEASRGSAVPSYRPEKRIRTPTLTSRGVPIVDGLVWTKYVLSSRFCTPKKT